MDVDQKIRDYVERIFKDAEEAMNKASECDTVDGTVYYSGLANLYAIRAVATIGARIELELKQLRHKLEQ
jgi:hypothetical protein